MADDYREGGVSMDLKRAEELQSKMTPDYTKDCCPCTRCAEIVAGKETEIADLKLLNLGNLVLLEKAGATISALKSKLAKAKELLDEAYTVMDNHKVPGITAKEMSERYGKIHNQIGEYIGRCGIASSRGEVK